MKRLFILSIAMVVICLGLLCSCSGGSPDLKGTWVNPTNSRTATIELGESTFDSGGINFPGATLNSGANGTYEFKNDTLIVTFSNGVTEEYPMEKIDGIWALHANTLDPTMIWVKEDDVSTYLESHKVGIEIPFGLAWGDDGVSVIDKISKVSQTADDEYTGAIIKASQASLYGNNWDLEIKAGDSGLTHIRAILSAGETCNANALIEDMTNEFGVSPDYEEGLSDKYKWAAEGTTVELTIFDDTVWIDYSNE